MARHTKAKRKYQRRFGLIPDEQRPVRGTRPRGKLSAFGVSLEQKQKLKFIYGMLEKQFRRYYQEALRQRGNTEERFVQLLETRLDNVVYRLGLARTREQARQIVTHGHVLVDGKKVDIPSYHVKEGQIVTLKAKSMELPFVKENIEDSKERELVPWLVRKGPVGQVKSLPALSQVQLDVDVSLIIEYYSR